MKKYFTIGEVAKIKNVSHTSLRYYDEIGILVPAWVNPENGYRYYVKNQMILLDFITMSIYLGIPLKELGTYIQEDNDLDIESFILHAKNKINHSLKKFKKDLYFLETALEHLKNEKNVVEGEEYQKQIATRYFLTLPLPFEDDSELFDFTAYWQRMSKLYSLVDCHDLAISIEQGICLLRKGSELEAKFYVGIAETKKKKVEMAEVIKVPQGDFLCANYPDSHLRFAFEKYQRHPFFIEDGNMLIISDVLEKKLRKYNIPFEMQLRALRKR